MSQPTDGGPREDAFIYLLEDDEDVAALFRRGLEAEGFEVRICATVAAFRTAAAVQAPSLAVIDLGLPDGDGLAVLSDELMASGVPSIVVTGRGGLDDRVAGLELGADDYVVKPLDPRELVARVRAVLRRSARQSEARAAPAATSKDVALFAGWRADFGRLSLTDPQGAATPLSQADAALLRVFLEAPGRVLSRDFLLEACDGGADELFDRSIDVRVSRLRKKLRDPGQKPKHIRTVYGAGYVFASAVQWTG